MMAYREDPPAAGLPFPRRNLTRYTALAIVLALLVLLLPLPFFASPSGLRMFKHFGSEMLVLLFAAVVGAGALGAMGAFAVRGKQGPAAVIAGVPAVLVVVGASAANRGMRMALGAVEGESIDPSQAMRILAEGVAESDGSTSSGASSARRPAVRLPSVCSARRRRSTARARASRRAAHGSPL